VLHIYKSWAWESNSVSSITLKFQFENSTTRISYAAFEHVPMMMSPFHWERSLTLPSGFFFMRIPLTQPSLSSGVFPDTTSTFFGSVLERCYHFLQACSLTLPLLSSSAFSDAVSSFFDACFQLLQFSSSHSTMLSS
jgi:hypothetical protein